MPKIIIQFQGQEWSVELKEGSNTIGRSSNCTIPVRDTNMSREHCEIQLAGQVATVFDKGSMNGTLLNGAKVLERKLVPGDKIQIGASTIWFQEKKGGATVATAAPAPARHVSDDEPTKARPDAKPTTQRRTEGKIRVAGLIKDYGTWGKEGGLPAGAVIGVLSLVIIIGIAVAAIKFLGGGSGETDDPDNLVANAGFEQTGLDRIGWSVRGRQAGLSIDATAAHRGKQSLLLEKSGDPASLVEDIMLDEAFGLGTSRRVSLSAWAKGDGFNGRVALKVVWRTVTKGAIVLEERSVAVSKPDGWTELKHDFSAPPGAGAFEVGVSAISRTGRLFVDDVRLALSSGEARSPRVLGSFEVDVAPSGAFQVRQQGQPVLSSVLFMLPSTKEGTVPQTAVAGATVKEATEKQILIEGKAITPVGLVEVSFNQQIVLLDGGSALGVSWTFPNEALNQLDGVSAWALLPPGTVAANASGKSERVRLRTGSIETRVEYGAMAAVEVLDVQGTKVLVQALEAEPVMKSDGSGGLVPTEHSSVALVIRGGEASRAGAAEDPLKAANEEISKNQAYSAAVAILREHGRRLKDPKKREAAMARLAELEDLERRDWTEVQAARFRAWISRRAELFEVAKQRIAVYVKQWGAEAQAKAQPLREELDKLGAEAAVERDADRANRLLERAKAYAAAGKRALAAEVCEVLLSRYGATDAGREAADILKAVKGQ
jgi:hypothetical protein